MLTELTFENLAEYDGGTLAAMFDADLDAIRRDLQERPADTRKRKVSFTFELVPVAEDQMLARVETKASVKVTIPDRETRENVIASVRSRGGRLHFDPHNRIAIDDPRQLTIHDAADED